MTQSDHEAEIRRWAHELKIAEEELYIARFDLGAALHDALEDFMPVARMARIAGISRPTAYKLIRLAAGDEPGPRTRRFLIDPPHERAVAEKRRRFRELLEMPSRGEQEEDEYHRLLHDDDLWA